MVKQRAVQSERASKSMDDDSLKASPTALWDELSNRIDALVAAWETGAPPELRDFLVDGAPATRRLVLIELIKVDLEHRWIGGRAPKTLAQYLSEFPELSDESGIPSDLIYEEYHVRRQHGDTPDPEEYCTRFPQQADELRRLFGLVASDQSTVPKNSGRPAALDVGDQIDDFDLLARLGQGAFASVFLARQRSMQRLVAVKISSDRGSEPQTMAQLDHPHIVRVYDQRILPERRLRLLYMQLIPGGTLEGVIQYLRSTPPREWSGRTLIEAVDAALVKRGESAPIDSLARRRLSTCTWPEAVCWVGARLASALAYAHERGVLHRDVKPANVLMAADANPKLVDFNISFSSKVEGATPAAYFGGSLAYMSPEQLEACNPADERSADTLDGRSDIYSLGVLLWELLTGRRPFPDERIEGAWSQALKRMTAVRRQGVPADAKANLPADLPVGLDGTLLRCLAPEPQQRFDNAAQLARQLELCMHPRTQRLLHAHIDGPRRAVRRRPLWILVAAGLLPNLFTSGINIAYNLNAIFDALSIAEQELFVNVQLLIVNLLAYLIGTGLLVTLLWPILRGVQATRSGKAVTAVRAAELRARTLRFGDQVALVSATIWFITAFVFPIWLWVQFGTDSAMRRSHFVHLLCSQLLCGLIASMMTFFLVTFVSVHVVYPTLVRSDVPELGEVDRLRRLEGRVWVYFAFAVCAPFLSVILLWWIDTDLREAIGVLGMVGLGGFLLAFYLSASIRRDLGALSVAVAPPGEMPHSGPDASDSFWAS